MSNKEWVACIGEGSFACRPRNSISLSPAPPALPPVLLRIGPPPRPLFPVHISWSSTLLLPLPLTCLSATTYELYLLCSSLTSELLLLPATQFSLYLFASPLSPLPASARRAYAPCCCCCLCRCAGFPRAPLPVLAAMLSPFAWLYGRPDLFDSYSAGVLLVQVRVLPASLVSPPFHSIRAHM